MFIELFLQVVLTTKLTFSVDISGEKIFSFKNPSGHLANACTFQTSCRGILTLLSGAIAVTMTSRLYLNLYKTAVAEKSGRRLHAADTVFSGRSQYNVGPESTGVVLDTLWPEEISLNTYSQTPNEV
jgi:hypothetical protein